MIDVERYNRAVMAVLAAVKKRDEIPPLPVHVADQLDAASEQVRRSAEAMAWLQGSNIHAVAIGSPRMVKQSALIMTYVASMFEQDCVCAHVRGIQPLFLMPGAPYFSCIQCMPDGEELERLEAKMNASTDCDLCGRDTGDGLLWPDGMFANNLSVHVFLCDTCHSWLQTDELLLGGN